MKLQGAGVCLVSLLISDSLGYSSWPQLWVQYEGEESFTVRAYREREEGPLQGLRLPTGVPLAPAAPGFPFLRSLGSCHSSFCTSHGDSCLEGVFIHLDEPVWCPKCLCVVLTLASVALRIQLPDYWWQQETSCVSFPHHTACG